MPDGNDTLMPDPSTILGSLGGIQPQPGPGNAPLNVPMLGPAPAPPSLGPGNTRLPSGTAIPSPRGIQMSGVDPRVQQTVSLTKDIIPGLGRALLGKEHQSRKARQDAAMQLVGAYIGYMKSDNPEDRKAAEELLNNPKNVKLLEKASIRSKKYDVNSPEYMGVQMAFKQAQAREHDEMAAKAQQEQFQARLDQANAAMMRAYAAQQQAQAAGKRADVAEEAVKSRERVEKAKMDNRLAIVKATYDRRDAELKDRLASMERIAKMKEAGAMGRTKMRVGQQQAASELYKRLTALSSQYGKLVSEHNNLENNAKGITTWLTGESDELKAKLDANEAQQEAIWNQVTKVTSAWDAMKGAGIIVDPKDMAAPGGGTKGGRIIVRPEDMP